MLRKRQKDSNKAQIVENEEAIKEIIESGKWFDKLFLCFCL